MKAVVFSFSRIPRILSIFPFLSLLRLFNCNAVAMSATAESCLDLLYPGPDGALATLRLETYRQGVIEAEARIFIDRALTDKAVSAKLGDDLAKRAQDLLDERARLMLAYDGDRRAWYQSSGWQSRTKTLFAMAAEVAAKTSAVAQP